MSHLGSWGGLPAAGPRRIVRLADRFQPLPAEPGLSLLPYGNGRSYGDSCLNPGGIVLDTRGLDRFIAFDAQQGLLNCEAGVLLSDILRMVVPRGWFLPVTPGTRFVTLGGAIANDVHGKNHHQAGSFGCHVLDLELLRSDGSVRQCSAQQNPGLFAATIGGLGLTGLIRRARIQLKPCRSTALAGESLRFRGLDEFFALSEESGSAWEYSAAWVDCAATGSRLGRGLLLRGNHAGEPGLEPPREPALTVPLTPPLSMVNRWSVGAFNRAYYGRQRQDVSAQRWRGEQFFYPLDGVRHWNRIYGPRGFFQYQCVVPPPVARDALREILQKISRSGQGSFLAVLKLFGDRASPGLMSFARPGATLAMDFPNRGVVTRDLLRALDDTTMAAGGAVYPAKDARMSAEAFRAYFPGLETFSAWVDPAFSSAFWRRVTGAPSGDPGTRN
ncbi:MAG TPA: FAD-binding oxidoreductase [Solimonas sp.]